MAARDRRRLAAILAADVVGYSRLMQADETGTLSRLKDMREKVLDPAIAEYGGRIVKTTGDGLLAEFPSAVDAVQCAADLQTTMQALSAADALDRRLQLRIGINLGDIIIDDQDIYGDGVNIAARLEGLAAPGGICVSGTVRDHTGGKVEIELVDGGECELKNIGKPVHVWHWSPSHGDAPVPDRRLVRSRPTIAVLPFDNISGDPQQDYFADGLTEDLITALTHWRSFPVVARNSTFTYKGKATDVPQAARELGANYVVEGSVRKAGQRVRVTAQLIDGATGHHVWAERYDRDLEDIFLLQDELTHRIAAVLAPEVSRAELKRSAAKRPNDLDAWDHCLRGEALLARYSIEGAHEARAHFDNAIALDPAYSDAFTGLAHSYTQQVRLAATGDRAVLLQHAIDAAKRAIELDPESSRAHFALSTAYLLHDEQDLALAEAHLAVDLNPNDPEILHALGNKSDLAGDPAGIGRMELAQKLNLRDPSAHVHLAFLARAYVNARNPEAAIAKARAAIHRSPEYPPAHYILAIALAHAGRADDAAAALQRCEDLSPGFVASRADWRPYTDQESNKHLDAGLKKAMAPPATRSTA
jgi:adenylate cyclase